MKKVLALMLIAVMCVAIVGCSKKGSGGNVFNSAASKEESSESKEESSESKVEESSESKVEESSESSVEESSESSVEESSEESPEPEVEESPEPEVEESSVEESEEPEASEPEEAPEESSETEAPAGKYQIKDISFDVPEEWPEMESQSTDTMKYFQVGTGVYYIMTSPVPGADMHDKATQEAFMSGFSGQFDPFEVSDEKNETIGGRNAYRFKYAGQTSGMNVSGEAVIFCTDTDMYAVTLMLIGEDLGAYEENFQKAIDTITVK